MIQLRQGSTALRSGKKKRLSTFERLRGGFEMGTARRILLALVTAGCLFLAAWARIIPQKLDYVEGDTAKKTVRAPRSGTYVDPEEMDRLRAKAASLAPDVYDALPDATLKSLTALDDIFEKFGEVRANSTLPDVYARIEELRATLDIRLSADTLALAARDSTSDTALARVHEGVAGLVRREMGKEIRNNSDDLRKAREDIVDAARGLGLTSAFTAMAAEIGEAVLGNNRVLNVEATEKARRQKAGVVAEVTHSIQVGDLIIVAGEQVEARHIAALQAVGLMQATIDYARAIGVLVTATIMVLLLGLFAMRFSPESYQQFSHLVAIAAMIVLTAFAYRTIGPTWFESGALTVAVATSMVVALLFNVQLGMGIGVCNALLLAIITSNSDARMVVVAALSSAAGVLVVSQSGSKSRVIARAAPLMALLQPLLMVVGNEMFGITLTPRMVGIAAAGGLLGPLLAMGASVALERALGVTTEFRLMELGNPNEPVLQRLVREAPGSYQSSVMVGNLAEPAAEAIGANSLLVRTAAMYHDIGKTRRPYFFVENQFGGDNPHDRLSPHLSARVIINHVKDGMELAEEYALPPVIKDFIVQHHGTSLVGYFYQRAVEQVDDADDVHEADFRYPGPKPQTRETALFMLADTVEAAARTLDNPSTPEIEELVDRLIQAKIDDGQLEQAPLSFRDLTAVKHSFVSTIASMFHQRIKYPDQILREAEKARNGQAHGSANGERNGGGNGRTDKQHRSGPSEPAKDPAALPGDTTE